MGKILKGSNLDEKPGEELPRHLSLKAWLLQTKKCHFLNAKGTPPQGIPAFPTTYRACALQALGCIRVLQTWVKHQLGWNKSEPQALTPKIPPTETAFKLRYLGTL